MFFSWQKAQDVLPSAILKNLLMGTSGAIHLATTAEMALSHAGDSRDPQFFLQLGSDILLYAFEQDILNESFAHQLMLIDKSFPFLPKALKPLMHWLIDNYSEPENLRYFVRLLQKRDHGKLAHFLEEQIKKSNLNTYWLHQAYAIGMSENMQEFLATVISQVKNVPAPLIEILNGDLAFLQQKYDAAQSAYQKALTTLPLAAWQEKLAETFLRLGKRDEALEIFTKIVKNRPWHSSAVMRLHDLVEGLDIKLTPLPGKGAILFYTWNKDELIAKSLEAVFKGERCHAPVIVLDNGSTDSTPEIIKNFKAQAGENLISVTLPINIGAPAARNWLAALPETQNVDWLAYMDDDAIVPKNWLLRFGAAMQAYPTAGVYGCKVVDITNPLTIQSADFHMEEAEGELGGSKDVEAKFTISSLQMQCFDFGYFNYTRPCVSVTGCCHIFRRNFFNRVGGFDLRYSPSQYDDLEHDLRHAMRGELPVYQGHLSVQHVKHTGKEAAVNLSQMSNSFGNLMKLHMRYPQEDFNKIMQHDKEQALADIARKYSSLPL